MDGIDAVVADLDAETPTVIAAQTVPFTEEIRTELEAARRDPYLFPTGRLTRLDARLGDAFAKTALRVIDSAGLEPMQIAAIGSHGQTILHDPDHVPPTTLQIGDPHRIAALTGIVTVADFRRADLAAGGQGAPLAPLLHQALLASPCEHRAVLNLGGIANLTLISADGEVSGFDTGPANCLLDEWFRHHHHERFDRNGDWAASGHIDHAWLCQLLQDGYFSRPAPKSTGIEYFGWDWLSARLPTWADEKPADVQATLLALTAESVAHSLTLLPKANRPERFIVCGGGVHNSALIKQLGQRLAPLPLDSSAEFGLDPDHVEALLFAWLARERLASRSVATPEITGASRPVLAGTIFKG